MASWALSSFVAGVAGVLLAPRVRGPGRLRLLLALGGGGDRGGGDRALEQHPARVLGRVVPRGRAAAARQVPADEQLPCARRCDRRCRTSSGSRCWCSPALALSLGARRSVAGVDPPPPAARVGGATAVTDERARDGRRCCSSPALDSGCSAPPTTVWIDRFARIAILAIIFLSITVITGIAGQVSWPKLRSRRSARRRPRNSRRRRTCRCWSQSHRRRHRRARRGRW